MRGLAVITVAVAAFACNDPPSTECTDGDTRACYTGRDGSEDVGVCTAGVETCSGGRWPGVCLGDVTPFVERCNKADDDCDGEVDDVEGAGEPCRGANGCDGVTGCDLGELGCIAPDENQCGLCGGPSVDGLGVACSNDVCPGMMVCAADGMSAECNAPPQNECELCGGPPITGLGDVCMASAGCAGRLACNTAGTGTTCDCSAAICNDAGAIRSIVAPEAGDLVITEVIPSPSQVSDTVGEWFEVQVMRDVDLNGLALDRAGDTANPNVLNAYDCVRVTAGTRLVFAKNTEPTMNGGIATAMIYGTFTFSLIPGSVATPGDVRLLTGTTVVDSITWTSSTSGRALQLDPDLVDHVANDQASNFCNATQTYGAGDFGTPGMPNTQCASQPPAGQCDDNGFRPIVPPAAGSLVITEIMPNPAVEPGQEWLEVTNVGSAAFDLNGLGLERPDDTRMPDVVTSSTCKSLAPGAYALFARSSTASSNGGLPAPDATFGFTMVNGAGEVRVVDPASCAAGPPITCTTIYDSVPWTSTTDAASAQLQPTMLTTTANDSPANFCAGTAGYGDLANRGTPRAVNVCP